LNRIRRQTLRHLLAVAGACLLALGADPAASFGAARDDPPAASAASKQARKKAAARKRLARAVRHDPRVVTTRSFVRKAQLVDFLLPITVRLGRPEDLSADPVQASRPCAPEPWGFLFCRPRRDRDRRRGGGAQDIGPFKGD